MKIAQADILILPGLGGGDRGIWYARWETRIRTAQRVMQGDWGAPDARDWSHNVINAVEQATRPVVFIAHSLGVLTALHASPSLPKQKVAGAYFVAPPDITRLIQTFPETKSFSPCPTARLAYPSLVVASSNDPFCTLAIAKELAQNWGARFEPAGNCGHIDHASGQGPWPEGLLSFANFMASLP